MKRRTTPTLKISIPKINIADVESIDFLFKSVHSETAPAIIKKSYPKEVSFDSESGYFLLSFTEEETLLFKGSIAYMDTRPHLNGGKIPKTTIVSFDIESTLFGDADV